MVWKRAAMLAPASLAILAASAAVAGRTGPLRVCADPGNMPFSNNRGEGIENKIAEVLARNLGTWVQYYYRPGIERGMTRTTLYAEECDVMFDMPVDSERVLVTTPGAGNGADEICSLKKFHLRDRVAVLLRSRNG